MQLSRFKDKVTTLKAGLNKIILIFYYKIYCNLPCIANLNQIN